ncbi:MAG: TlpA family protein disulfide reductase [Planctomycetota bacterium]
MPKEGKRLWATSRLWAKAPDFVVEKWLTAEPDISGKYVLITFWATWCRQCRRLGPGLNDIHRKFADELVVIGISDEKEQIVRKLRELKIEYHVAIDTQARMKNDLGVFGIPHCIIVEPDGYVVWEGFPLLKGHELTEEVVEKILKVGKKRQPVTDSGS